MDKRTNAKLKVTFFWPFSGNYWIIDLAPDYSYAVVGEPDRKYLWILSRSSQLTESVYGQIVTRVRELDLFIGAAVTYCCPSASRARWAFASIPPSGSHRRQIPTISSGAKSIVANPKAQSPQQAAARRKVRRNVTVGVAHIKATFNNTTITITDTKGDVLCWASAGTSGFKGSRKSTPFAGQMSAQQVADKAIKCGMKEVDVKVRGPGSGRRARSRRCRRQV